MTLNLQCINLKWREREKKRTANTSERKAIWCKTFSFYLCSLNFSRFIFLSGSFCFITPRSLRRAKSGMQKWLKKKLAHAYTHTCTTRIKCHSYFPFRPACAQHVFRMCADTTSVDGVFVHRLRCKYTFSKWYNKIINNKIYAKNMQHEVYLH